MKWLSSIARRVPQLGRWLPGSKPGNDPTIVPRDAHNVSRRHIHDGALKVIARLRAGGFQAYLVGGSVRDLLLGGRPKDFDVATDATPEQIRELFRNSRIIGRRFKIVHVRFGPEIIEVTTFRGGHDNEAALDKRHANRSEDGMLLRDNVFGSIEEDAVRRDFTVNALYYTTEDFSVRDYTGGMADLEARVIRLIGNPETRFREDPVRMLRAVRFAAKLDFTIHADTLAPMERLAPLVAAVPPARLFDEMLKLFMAGHAERTYALLETYGLFTVLFPDTAAAFDEPGGERQETLLRLALRNTDRRVAEEKPVTPAFLFAALLWPALLDERTRLEHGGMPGALAIQQAASTVLERQQRITAIPRRFSLPAREIWELQWRLPSRQPRRIERLLEHPRLRAAYDFLLLREEVGEELDGAGAWWTRFLAAEEEERPQLLREVQRSDADGKRRRRRRR